MFRSRLIRTVVNLSLIVVMMIQPGMALVFANDCGVKRASGYMCEGCRCCEVASPEDKCSCCGGGENADGDQGCCMDDTQSADAWDSPDEMTQSDETLQLKVIVISTDEPAVADGCDAEANASQTSDQVSSTCGCGVESPPLSESAPSRPTVAPRESVAVRHSDLADLFGGSMLPRPRLRDVGEVLPSSNFSQTQLGVWRL